MGRAGAGRKRQCGEIVGNVIISVDCSEVQQPHWRRMV